MRILLIAIYYIFLRYLPSPTFPLLGPFFEWIRFKTCSGIFKSCGKKVNIATGAFFGDGRNIEIGEYSGIGVNCKVPNDIKIGDNVMMAPNVIVLNSKHNFDRTDIPMVHQGSTKLVTPIIEDDVWIGTNSIILPEVTLKKGTIVAAGSIVTKTFPQYSIIGGNPARLIRSRLESNK